MKGQELYPGTGIGAVRSLWLLIAISMALLPLAGMPHPFAAFCGAVALVAVGAVFRRWVLFPVVATALFLIVWLTDIRALSLFIHSLLRGLFS